MRRVICGLAVVLGVLAGTTSSAAAATVITGDPRGDAPVRYDMTTLTYGNTSEVISVKVRVADLKPRGRTTFGFNLTTTADDASYMARTTRRKGGSVTAWLRYSDTYEKVDCDVAANWRPRRNIVRVSFPQSCLESQGKVSIQPFMGNPAWGDPADQAKRVAVPFD